MKVVYEKNIIEQIREAKRDADRNRKKIEYISLSDKEALKLYDETKGYYSSNRFDVYSDLAKLHLIHLSYLYGIGIRVESLMR